jgi:5-methylcytosine-specific restriction endonuclease McrA
MFNGWAKSGVRRYKPHCVSCYRKPYRLYKKASCDLCGFVALHPTQLDVDHIDNDHSNNDPENLQTLCANCHRLKTHLNRKFHDPHMKKA